MERLWCRVGTRLTGDHCKLHKCLTAMLCTCNKHNIECKPGKEKTSKFLKKGARANPADLKGIQHGSFTKQTQAKCLSSRHALSPGSVPVWQPVGTPGPAGLRAGRSVTPGVKGSQGRGSSGEGPEGSECPVVRDSAPGSRGLWEGGHVWKASARALLASGLGTTGAEGHLGGSPLSGESTAAAACAGGGTQELQVEVALGRAFGFLLTKALGDSISTSPGRP